MRFNWSTGLRMANVSLFVFRFTARRLHVTSRSAAATIPGHTRNLIVRSASAWPQLPRNYGGQDNIAVTRSTLNLSLSVRRSYSTSQVVRSSAGRHWYTERLVSVGLLVLIPTGLVYPNPVVDYGLAVLVPIHGHWGLMAVVEDYVPQVLKPVGKGLVYVLSFGAFAGLMYLNMRDVGICGAVRTVWSL